MDLFELSRKNHSKKNSSLSFRMRPETLDDVVGQEHIIGEGKLLYRLIKADKLTSIILYGPPGTGKTTIASVIAATTKSDFVSINATVSGKKDMVAVVEDAMKKIVTSGNRTILFIDEIHRFNKAQQDYLLPYVEDGTIILIGATTENPYFEVNKALLSRSTIFKLNPLSKENIKKLIENTLKDKEKGLGLYNVNVDEDAIDFLCEISSGDARRALNGLELAVETTTPDGDIIHITKQIISDSTQARIVSYDKDGDEHYDTISAFIKSMRGNDPQACSYYLAKMLQAGEDINFISRRIIICAAEDVGLANPNALVVANAAAEAVRNIGMPEARIILSEAALYVCLSPKSNSAIMAVDLALKNVSSVKTTVPAHLRDAHYEGSSEFGHGIDYKYPHNYPNHYVKQQYLPDEIKDEEFYEFGDIGFEKKLKEYMLRIINNS